MIAPRTFAAGVLVAAALCLSAVPRSSRAAQEHSCTGPMRQEAALCLVVLVSRHSIRSPLPYEPPAELLTRRSAGWPLWAPPADVPGNLTAHGKDVAVALGAYYRELYAHAGLVPPRGRCPEDTGIWAYADTSERTIQTAQGIIAGFFRGDPARCGAVVHRTAGSVDTIFKPVQAGAARANPRKAEREAAALAGGQIASLITTYREPLAMMQRILDCCQPPACVTVGVPAPCGLFEIPTRLVTDRARGTVSLRGGVALAGGLADDFLLQYAEGMPVRGCSAAPHAPCVGWGRITPADLRVLLRLYVLKQTIDNRPPAIARASGSHLLRQILGAIGRKAGVAAPQATVVPPAAKFAIFVGHDTYLSNLGGLLRLSWETQDYPPDTTPPASALIFELYRRGTAGFVVRTSFLTMTPDQFRTPGAVSASAPPRRVALVVPGCGAVDCPLERFSRIAAAAIGPP